MRCPECGLQNCCGGEMSLDIERLTAEVERLGIATGKMSSAYAAKVNYLEAELAAERQGARLPGELVERLRELNTVLIPGAILSPDERALRRDILAAVEREQGETP